MDAAWTFREAYNEARKVKDAQDEFCRMAERGQWEQLAAWRFTAATAAVAAPMFEGDTGNGFPESLKWEMLVDVLRGRVKVCYADPSVWTLYEFGIVSMVRYFRFQTTAMKPWISI